MQLEMPQLDTMAYGWEYVWVGVMVGVGMVVIVRGLMWGMMMRKEELGEEGEVGVWGLEELLLRGLQEE